MLVLPIKKQWFDMIAANIKTEEYREIKPYYQARFQTIGLLSDNIPTEKMVDILFRNGYGSACPSFVAKCSLSIGKGKEEWGANDGATYYILKIHHVDKKS